MNVLNYIVGCLLLFASYVVEAASFGFRYSFFYACLFGGLGIVILMVGVAFTVVRQLTKEERDWLRRLFQREATSN